MLQEQFNQACHDDRHDVIDTMIADGYIPTDESMTIACKQGNQTLVLKLLQYPDLDVQPGFMEAVKNDHLHLLDHLYTRIDVNKVNKIGITALHLALLESADIQVVRWLLDMGARQIPNDHGDTPLHYACVSGTTKIVELLLQYMDNQTPNNDGDTPLHYACSEENVEIVGLLLEHMKGDIIQTPNVDGYTPLHIACMFNKIEHVKLLLQYIRNHKQDNDIVQLLEEVSIN